MQNQKEKDGLNAFYEAFNEFTDHQSAATALSRLVRQVRAHEPTIENVEQVLKCLEGPASSFTIYRSLAFVDMRVNAHKHLAHGVSQKTPRPLAVKWCITVNAYNGLTRLVQRLHFGDSHRSWMATQGT